jgi:effector-binding domain-containing protein
MTIDKRAEIHPPVFLYMTCSRHIYDVRIRYHHKGGHIMYEAFELTEQKEQPVLSVRTRTPVANLTVELGKAYQSIFTFLGQIGENPAGAPFAAFYNMDMQNLDVEIGIPVSKPIAGEGEVKQSSIPADKQASCIYKGAYDQISPAYEALTKWITEKNQVPTGICYEYYLNTPGTVPDSELLTKIVFLLK